VIIDHGRVVLAGELAALRAAVPERLVDVCYRGDAPEWGRLGGVDVVESKDGDVRLRVAEDVDPTEILALLRGRAEVVSFAYHPPALSELFRQAVRA
jgi:ABC-2 type transport system ATP-binding protein